MLDSRPGYEYLSAYTLGKVIQDLTVVFCDRYIDRKSRTHDQMVQAARSNSQLRQRNLPIWDKNDERIKKFREFTAVWVSPTSLNTPKLSNDPADAANMLLTFCNMEGFLLKRLVASLLSKHEKEGGLTEELYRKRVEYRDHKT